MYVVRSIPAFLGSDLHEPSPCSLMYLARISSSSLVHLPFFNPTFSQHGALPILTSFLCLGEERRARRHRKRERDHHCNCKKCGCLLRASPRLRCGVGWKREKKTFAWALLGSVDTYTHIYTNGTPRRRRWVSNLRGTFHRGHVIINALFVWTYLADKSGLKILLANFIWEKNIIY